MKPCTTFGNPSACQPWHASVTRAMEIRGVQAGKTHQPMQCGANREQPKLLLTATANSARMRISELKRLWRASVKSKTTTARGPFSLARPALPHQSPLATTRRHLFIFRYKILLNKQATFPYRP